MVAGQPCPECASAPRMEHVGMSPRPNATAHVVLECPNCGHRTTVDPSGSDDGGIW